MQVARHVDVGEATPPAEHQEQSGSFRSEPLLKDTEIDKALEAAFASVSGIFAAKLGGDESSPAPPQSKLKDFGLDATSSEFAKLRNELLRAAMRLRKATWERVAGDSKLQDLHRAAGAECAKGTKLANERSNRASSNGNTDFLKKQHADTLRQIAGTKEGPEKLQAQKVQLQEEFAAFTAERKRLLVDRKAIDQHRRKLVAMTQKILADHNPGGTKEKQRKEVENALLMQIEKFPERCLVEVERARIAHAEENQRLAAGWSDEKLKLQEEMALIQDENERWMMQAEECRQLLVSATALHDSDSLMQLLDEKPDLDSLMQLLDDTKRWEDEEDKEEAHVAALQGKLLRLQSQVGLKKGSTEADIEKKKEAIQSLKSQLTTAEEALSSRRRLRKQVRRGSVEDQTALRSSSKAGSSSSKAGSRSSSKAGSNKWHLQPSPDSGPKDSLHLDIRQGLVRNGAKVYLQWKELQQLLEDNRRLENEYSEALHRKNEEEASVYKALEDAIGAPAKLRNELDAVLKEVTGLRNSLKRLRRQVLKLSFEGRTNTLVYTLKHHSLCKSIEQKEKVLGGIATGVINTDIQRAGLAAQQLADLSEREPALEKDLRFEKKLAVHVFDEFAKVDAITQFEVNRLLRFKDRGAVTLLLQAVDQHVMNIEQHAAERDINTQFEGLMQAART